MKCTCQSHLCSPGCGCGNSGPYHRFSTQRITKFNPECLQHGYLFKINIAADLRYGD